MSDNINKTVSRGSFPLFPKQIVSSCKRLFFLHLPRKSLGFTLAELLISITLIGIISVSLVTIITNYLVVVTRNNVFVDMTDDSQNLLRTVVEELRYGAGVRESSTINDPSISGSPPEWSTSNAGFVIIIATPAVDSNDSYIINPATGEPYQNELVYYKSGKLLYKRTLAAVDADGNPLPGNRIRTSCPPSSATPSCLADRELTEYVKDFVFTLYDQNDTLTTDPFLARSVKIDLALEKDSFGQPLEFDNRIRVTLRNTF